MRDVVRRAYETVAFTLAGAAFSVMAFACLVGYVMVCVGDLGYRERYETMGDWSEI